MDGVSGFLSPKRFINGVFKGYDLYDVRSGEVHPFLLYDPLNTPLVDPHVEARHIGPFMIDQSGLEFASGIIAAAFKNRNCNTIVLDEIGMAEVEGRLFKGILELCLSWHDAYDQTDHDAPERNLFIVVQERALNNLMALYGNLKIAQILRK